MNTARTHTKQAGFTLVELMISLAVFVLLSAAMFGLLNLAQRRSHTESQLLASFEEARLGLDQIVRDVSGAGYPPLNHFSVVPAANLYAVSPVAWSPTYPATPCQIGTGGGGTCVSPGDFDLIIETDIDPDAADGVEWVRYQLQGTTLFRGVLKPKGGGPDPVGIIDAAGVMVPYVLNVMNNPPVARLAQIQAAYPAMFPGGNPQPIFQFTCDTAAGPVLCQNAGASNSPANVRSVDIRLIVIAPQPDAQTGAPRLVELNGRGRRINPNQ